MLPQPTPKPDALAGRTPHKRVADFLWGNAQPPSSDHGEIAGRRQHGMFIQGKDTRVACTAASCPHGLRPGRQHIWVTDAHTWRRESHTRTRTGETYSRNHQQHPHGQIVVQERMRTVPAGEKRSHGVSFFWLVFSFRSNACGQKGRGGEGREAARGPHAPRMAAAHARPSARNRCGSTLQATGIQSGGAARERKEIYLLAVPPTECAAH